MLALVPLAGVLLVAGAVDLNATLVAETRAGQAPLRPDQGPTAGVVGVLTPGGELAVTRTDLDFRLEYSPRIFWRQPNEVHRLRPLVLHVGNLTLTTRLTPRTALTGGASVSAGEVDYTALPQLFGSVQASLPPVARILVVTARAGLDVQATHLTRVGVALEASHRRPLDDVDAMTAAGSAFLLPQTGVQVAPYTNTRVSRLDDVSFATAVAYRWFANQVDFFSVTPQIGWRRRLSSTDEFRLGAGVTYGYGRYGPMRTGPLAGATLAPVGSGEVLGLLARHRGISLQGSAGAMVDYYVDPILTQAQKRLTLAGRLLLSLGARWTVGLETALGSTLEPLLAPDLGPGTVPGLPPDATYVAVSVPVRHRLAANAILEFGARWADRAPHTETAMFDFHQRQLWAYAMLTVTTREVPRWGMPDGGDSDRRNRGRQPSDTEAVTSSAVTSRVTSRTTDRVTSITATGTAAGTSAAGGTGTGGTSGTATPTTVPGQQGQNGRPPFDPSEEESETQRQRELPDQSQLPIGIGGVR